MVSGYHNSTKGLADQFWAQREPARKESILASNLRQGRAEETQTCVARRYCCRFEMRGSYTDCFFISGYHSSQRLLSREEVERTIFPSSITINAQPWILLRDLPAANLCEVFYRRETAVFCQSERDSVERGGKGSHGVLFDRGNLLRVYEKVKENVRPAGHTSSAAFETAIAQLMSADPPPYTTRLSTIMLRTTQMASWSARLASSTIYSGRKAS